MLLSACPHQVATLKQRIEEDQGSNFPASGQKLIYSGEQRYSIDRAIGKARQSMPWPDHFFGSFFYQERVHVYND